MPAGVTGTVILTGLSGKLAVCATANPLVITEMMPIISLLIRCLLGFIDRCNIILAPHNYTTTIWNNCGNTYSRNGPKYAGTHPAAFDERHRTGYLASRPTARRKAAGVPAWRIAYARARGIIDADYAEIGGCGAACRDLRAQTAGRRTHRPAGVPGGIGERGSQA